MALPIKDYALIGDCRSAALVGRDGSIDWLCWPRFDSAACFAALLGTVENGRWLLAPQQPIIAVDRHYLPGTLVLETEFKTATRRAAIVDFMPFEDGANLVRIAMGRCGRVDFRNEFIVCFNYGAIIPWASHLADGSVDAIAGPERVVLRTAAAVHYQEFGRPGGVHRRSRRVRPLRPLIRIFLSRPPTVDRSVQCSEEYRVHLAPMERSMPQCWALD